MRTCNQCKKEIPFTVVVDGKSRNLQRRKFCLECSPFGTHNTRKALNGDVPNNSFDKFIERACSKHGLTTFVLQKGGYRCKTCRNATVSDNRRKRKSRLVQLFGGKCTVCGYGKCDAALDFHHLDATQKEFGISKRGLTIAFEKLVEEAKKCTLLCCRCHRELENGLITI